MTYGKNLFFKISIFIVFVIVGWTFISSTVFLFGTGLYSDFQYPYYQWWAYEFANTDNSMVSLWLKIGAGLGAVPIILLLAAIIFRRRSVNAPRLRRRFWGGFSKSPIAVTDNHGRARWMTMDEAQKRYPGINSEYGGVVVGEAYRVDLDKASSSRFIPEDSSTWGKGGKAQLLIDPCTQGPTHSLVIVGSGGFKTTAAVSTLLTWTGSVVVLDPSGEVAPILKLARQNMGHTVLELDLESNVGFNVLDWIDIKSPLAPANIDSIVTWVCGEKKDTSDSGKDFFDTMGRNVVRCFIAHLLYDKTADTKLKNLHTVRYAISMPTEKMRVVLRTIYETSSSSYARQLAGPICGLVDETFSGVIGSAAEMTTWLANDAYCRIVSGDSFKTSDILNGKVTIFLKMPLKVLETTPGISRTVIGALLNSAYEANGNLNGRILYLLDEVARLGYMKILETARDAGRKYGITLQLLYQSIGQIIDQWGEQGKRAWYDGVSWRGFAAVQDDDTAKEIEESFGTYGVMATSEGKNSGSSGKGLEIASLSKGDNLSFHEISRPLIRKAELTQEVREDEFFVIARSARPLRCGRAIYFRRSDMLNRSGTNRFYKGRSK